MLQLHIAALDNIKTENVMPQSCAKVCASVNYTFADSRSKRYGCTTRAEARGEARRCRTLKCDGTPEQRGWRSGHGSTGRQLFLWFRSRTYRCCEHEAETGVWGGGKSTKKKPQQQITHLLSAAGAVSLMPEKSCLKVNPRVTGDDGVHLSARPLSSLL